MLVWTIASGSTAGCGDTNPSETVSASQAWLTTTTTLEAENLSRTSSAIGTNVSTGDCASSNCAYVQFAGAAAINDWIEFSLPGLAAATYTITTYYKANNNRGIHRASIDGTTIGSSCDEYLGTAQTQVPCTFGSTTLSAGDHRLRLTVTGKNAASSGFATTLDKITLTWDNGGSGGAGGSSGSGGAAGSGGAGGASNALSINIVPAGAATVTLIPAGGVYAPGTTVTLLAAPASGYQFTNWNGPVSNTVVNPTTVVMNGNRSVTATFASAAVFQSGDMQYYNGISWIRIPPGVPGQVLSQNSSGIPTWTNNGTWVDFSTATIMGWSSTIRKSIRYMVIGKTVILYFTIWGTSDSNYLGINLPFPLSSTVWNTTGPTTLARDNPNTEWILGMYHINCSNSCGRLDISPLDSVWPTSGTKATDGTIIYEME